MNTDERIAPEGVSPTEFNDALIGEIRAVMARLGLTNQDLRRLITEQTGESPGSQMWPIRRLSTGEVPLYRPAVVIPEKLSPDLDLIAKALGVTPETLIRRARETLAEESDTH